MSYFLDDLDINVTILPTASTFMGIPPNYISYENDGTLVMNGDATVWLDIDFPIIIRTVGVGQPVLTTLQGNITAPVWQVNDFNICEGQELVHSWKEESPLYWHIHLITNGTNVDNRYVKFEVEYTWANSSGVLSANDTLSAEILIPANTPSKTMVSANLGDFIPVGGKITSHVYARLKRVASTGLAPTGNPFVTMLQLHYEQDTFGSRGIVTK